MSGASAIPPVEDRAGEVPLLPGLAFLLGVAHRVERRAWEQQLVEAGLTAPQAALLRMIAAQPGAGVRQLARALRTDPMNAQRICETLLAAGLCEARADPADARRRPLYLTDAGQRMAGEVTTAALAAEQRLAAALGAARYTALLDGLRQLVELEQGR